MPSLDKCLRGGFRIGTISELVGRAGAGKSQLAMQMCVMAAKYGQGSVYIDTEKKLSLERLKEIADERSGRVASQEDEGGSGEFSYGASLTGVDVQDMNDLLYDVDEVAPFSYKSAREVLANVTVHTPASTHELLSVVSGIEDDILLRNQQAEEDTSVYPVSLIILDSIASPTRRDFGSESAPQRVSAVLQLAQMLKRLADQLQLVIVVINQVGLNEHIHTVESSGGSDLVAVKAALGTSWHHCLSTRLLMEHVRDPHTLNSRIDDTHDSMNLTIDSQCGCAWKHEQQGVRKATVVKSNIAGAASMFYEVSAIGLAEIHFDSEI
jgi:RAD51-like protein 1